MVVNCEALVDQVPDGGPNVRQVKIGEAVGEVPDLGASAAFQQCIMHTRRLDVVPDFARVENVPSRVNATFRDVLVSDQNEPITAAFGKLVIEKFHQCFGFAGGAAFRLNDEVRNRPIDRCSTHIDDVKDRFALYHNAMRTVLRLDLERVVAGEQDLHETSFQVALEAVVGVRGTVYDHDAARRDGLYELLFLDYIAQRPF